MNIHVKTLMTHEAFPGGQGPRVGNFFETPGTYTIFERCGNFIYPIGDSKQAQILLNMGTVLTDVVFSYRKCPTSRIPKSGNFFETPCTIVVAHPTSYFNGTSFV